MSRFSYILYIDMADDPGALWTGLGWLDLPADAVLPVTTRFLGGGALVSLPDFQQLINGIADRLSLGVSGVAMETMRLAMEQSVGVKDCDIYLGRVSFDAQWQVSTVAWIGEFRADKITTEHQNDQRSIALSVSTQNTGRNSAPTAFFTQNDQRKRSNDDEYFVNVSALVAGTSRRFHLKDEDD